MQAVPLRRAYLERPRVPPARSSRKAVLLPETRVSPATLPSEIYDRIRQMILDGRISPGEIVTMQGLADAFGVSLTPVREALQRLVGERALAIVSGRSVGIPDLDPRNFEDLSKVRIEVEGLAAEWAAPRLTSGEIGRLSALIVTMDEAIATSDTRRYVQANYEFHFGVYRASGSDTLLSIIETLWLRVSPYFHLLHGAGNYPTANREHRLILKALRESDGKACRRHIREDIEAARKALLAPRGPRTVHRGRASSA